MRLTTGGPAFRSEFSSFGCPILLDVFWRGGGLGVPSQYNNQMTLPKIQRAIESLSQDEQVTLATWLAERDLAAWDSEIERDSAAGGAASAMLENVRQQVRLRGAGYQG